MMKTPKFGAKLQECRIKKGMTLREYCRRLNKDPGNVSKLERGLLPAPKTEETIKEYANALGIPDDSEEMNELIALAAAESGAIPKDMLEDDEIVNRLPLLFRTATGSKLERDKLLQFLDGLKKV